MYQTYGEEKVLDGWLAPFPYIRIGRQKSEEGEIAKGEADCASYCRAEQCGL